METWTGLEEISIVEAAEALAQSIRQSPVFLKWRKAQAAFENDPVVHKALQTLQSLSAQYQKGRSQGKGLSGNEVAELVQAQRDLQTSPLHRDREQAGAEFAAFLRQINQVLSNSLGLDFAENAAPRGGGGCCG